MALRHRTTYTFAERVEVHPHTIRLRPAPHSRTPIEAYSLTVEPAGHFLNWQQDPFGNWLARLVFPDKVDHLDITVDLVADLTVINPFDFFIEEYAEEFPFAYPEELRTDLEPYLRPVDESGPGTGPGPIVTDWMARQGLVGELTPRRTVDFLVGLNQAVNDAVDYTVRLEAGVQTPDHTLTAALGSCRDSAWLLVSVLRQLGLAARFVSGYLVQLAPDVRPLDGPGGPTEDFTDLHAWAEVFVPGAGWIGLDATSGLFAGEGHIPLSATPHPSSAAPITGATGPVHVTFGFENVVSRIHEDPRVTKPYTDEQWTAVTALGADVDALLREGDVRLTMGGEPTFVSAGDTSAPEWETDADGEEKRALATLLAARLRERWAAGGVVHHGQGKWYPGEPLPRWQIQLSWRADGVPLWRDPALLDDPWAGPRRLPADAPLRLAAQIAETLGVGAAGGEAGGVVAAYDDPFERLWSEARLPEGAPPEDLDPDADPASVTEADATADEPRAFVVPLFCDPEDEDAWATTRWRTRRARLFLTPGSSAAGYRLPLDSLAWEPPPGEVERSTFAAEWAPYDGPPAEASYRTARVLDIADAPRHALVVEEREGHLFVFLPPIATMAAGVRLLEAIESAAAAAETPVVLEGYGLPFDPGVRSLSVTPDPGVIEVNVQPTRSFAELAELTTTLYDDAREVGLATEKFDLDGTHTGTGGGNHFTLGGATPADSPLLRRPDLLVSLLTFWQHHPALSYVFSGKFIGPTSQAPRVDEGRLETLYELEIAFAELARVTARLAAEGGEDTPAWHADRALRHLLADLTGNTHRSEFCIDKLYSPDGERGRLGLLELRGFETPPHARMALVQALLVRALVAAFWEQPYAGPLVRWGTTLHDRFLLPSFAAVDLRGAVRDLNERLAGLGVGTFDPAWLDPFVEFRFPRLGTVDVDGVRLELRAAIEPWHVLGEEMSSGGTARYVDSSVERVEVSAEGLIEGRHVLTCNGVPVPLLPTDRPGVSAGGVRFRAWSPYSALHPTIEVQAPLVFDLVDVPHRRALGGFTYHVSHPGGRSYDTYPVNAMEAEARRSSRFRAGGHTPGPVDVDAWPSVDDLRGRPGAASREYPATLDLRRFVR